MKNFLLGLTCILCCAVSQAAELTVWRLPAGLYAVQDGSIIKVNELTLDPSPTPVVPVPVPSSLTERGKAIMAAATKVTKDPNRTTTAKQLAQLYVELAKKVTAGDLKTQEMIAFGVKYGTDTLLLGQGKAVKEAWQPVRDVLSEQWAAVVQEGGDDADYAKLLNECAAGLNASAPQKEAIDIAKILEIIKMIMSIIAMFS